MLLQHNRPAIGSGASVRSHCSSSSFIALIEETIQLIFCNRSKEEEEVEMLSESLREGAKRIKQLDE